MRYTHRMEQISIPETAHALRETPQKAMNFAEGKYGEKILSVCRELESREAKVLLLPGPSSSGKTTTAKMIAAELKNRGSRVNRISLDNFYKSLDELPLWEDGSRNCESVEGLDIACFAECMEQLLREGRAGFPIYDFSVKRRLDTRKELLYDEHTYVVVEGIHALNPLISGALHGRPCLQVYISVHSDFLDGAGNVRLAARDLRLMRRIVRDFHFRATPVMETLRMWDYVLKGEELYIHPFRERADLHINSTHFYEPFLYREKLLEILDGAQGDSPWNATVRRLIKDEETFFPIDSRLVPRYSLIREFIGQE